MAISLYIGLPGAGKSYGVVENVIMPGLEADRPIYTNLPLIESEIYQAYPNADITLVQNDEIDGDYLMNIPGGALIVFDEIWRFWPGGQKLKDCPDKQREFFAEHRHKAGDNGLTQEIALITQNASQVSRWLREMIDKTVVIQKNDAVGSSRSYQWAVYQGVNTKGQIINKAIGTYKPEVYRFYKSHTKAELNTPALERVVDTRANIWKSAYFRYFLPLTVLGAAFAVYWMYGFWQAQKAKTAPKTSQTSEVKPIAAPAPVPPPPAPLPVPEKARPQESKSMRIVGSYSDGQNTIVLIQRKGIKRLIKVNQIGCQSLPHSPVCEISGELVSYYTGEDENSTILGKMDDAAKGKDGE